MAAEGGGRMTAPLTARVRYGAAEGSAPADGVATGDLIDPGTVDVLAGAPSGLATLVEINNRGLTGDSWWLVLDMDAWVAPWADMLPDAPGGLAIPLTQMADGRWRSTSPRRRDAAPGRTSMVLSVRGAVPAWPLPGEDQAPAVTGTCITRAELEAQFGVAVPPVDDVAVSRWATTIAAWLLRSHGSGPVWPLALAAAPGR